VASGPATSALPRSSPRGLLLGDGSVPASEWPGELKTGALASDSTVFKEVLQC
jgi:hypothetical protein